MENFDENIGVKFETYAYARVWGSVIDGIREEDRVPRSVRMRQSTIEKMKQEIEIEDGRKVSDEEAALRAGIDLKEYNKNRHKFHANTCFSIESNVNHDIDNEDNKKDCNESLVDSNCSSVDSQLVRKEFLSKLMGRNFTPTERKIIYYYYRSTS